MDERVAAWAASGAMWLTGRPDGPALGPPAPLVDALRSLGARLAELAGSPMPDPLALLGERAAIAGLRRGGDTSCGGASRLLPVRDGWVAVTLARDDDIDAVPAWLEVDGPIDAPWDAIAAALAGRRIDHVVDRAVLLGLPVAAVPPMPRPCLRGAPPFDGLPVVATAAGPRVEPVPGRPTVVDLTALWAGPLATHLLGLAGCDVVKVESVRRPDGARLGPTEFHDLLNAGKRAVALDFRSNDGLAALHRLVGAADVVVTAARPRALAQLGLDPRAWSLAPNGPHAWIELTAWGREIEGPGRVGFGDDIAAGAGAVVWDGNGPCFCGDALADPVSGVTAAAAALVALRSARRWHVEVPMVEVAATLTGPTIPVADPVEAVSPRSRVPAGAARPLGADTDAVLAGLRD